MIGKLGEDRKTVKIKMAALFVTISVIMLVLFIYYYNSPKPIPRNIRILVDDESSQTQTLFEINDNIFEVIFFNAIRDTNFERGFYLEDYTIEDFELLDEALLDVFNESFNIPGHSNSNLRGSQSVGIHKIVVRRWSMELSRQELNNIRRMIDRTVRNYEEYNQISYHSNRTVRAIIDDELYYSRYIRNEVFYSQNYKYPLKERKLLNRTTDINLIKLAYHLAELASIHMDEWHYPPFPRPTR